MAYNFDLPSIPRQYIFSPTFIASFPSRLKKPNVKEHHDL